MKRLLIALLGISTMFAAPTAKADIIDQIGPAFATFAAPGGFVSAYSMTDTFAGPGGLGAFSEAYDNFTFGTTLAVTQLEWVGIYDGDSASTGPGGNLGLLNPSAITPSFTVRFYDDNANTPGTLLHTVSVVGNGNQTALAVAPMGAVEPLVYSYSSAITGFNATAGTQYWVSVVAAMDYVENGWGLALSNQGDLRSAQFFDPTTNIDTTFDYAIRITAVPEPGSGLCLLTIAGITMLRRSKRTS